MSQTKMITRQVNGVDTQILTMLPRPTTNAEATVWQNEFAKLIDVPGKHVDCVIYLTKSKDGSSYSFNEDKLVKATAHLNLTQSNVIAIGQQIVGAAKGNNGKNVTSMGKIIGKTEQGLDVCVVKFKLAKVKVTHIALTKDGVEKDVLEGTYTPIVNFTNGHTDRTNAVIDDYENSEAAKNVFVKVLHDENANLELKFRAAEGYSKVLKVVVAEATL